MATTQQQPTTFEVPGSPGSPVEVKARYENFIGGHWMAPIDGEYRANLTPATGRPICEVAHSGAQDIELALDAAHAARDGWEETSATERSKVLNGLLVSYDQSPMGLF